MEGLEEFLIIPNPEIASTSGIISWTHNQTLTLIDYYKKYKPKVGTLYVKSMKKLWEILAHEVNRIHNANVTGSHCENRWRVIERNYKKYIDDSKKTGRARKMFEYSAEMNEIFGNKRNVNPEILLSSSTVHHEPNQQQEVETTPMLTPVIADDVTDSTIKSIHTPKPTPRRVRKRIINKNIVLEQMRQDKKEFYANLIKVHEARQDFLKRKHQETKEIQEKKMDELRKQNELLETKNEILDKYLKLKVSLVFFNSLLFKTKVPMSASQK